MATTSALLMPKTLSRKLAGGVIEVDDGLLGSLDRFEGAADEVLAGLGEHLDTHVVGDVAALDEAAHEAEFGFRGRGKATSISLKPMAQSILNMRIFFSAFIGSKSDWLPSRRSVLIQIGGFSMMRFGQLRSTSFTGGNAWYLVFGVCNMMVAPGRRDALIG
jgi:hypothetical protein